MVWQNGLQFDTAGNLMVTGAGGGGVALSAGTNSTSTGTVVFSNSNGVSFGMDTNGVVTATVTAFASATAGIAGIAAVGATATSGTVSFSNSNGITFGMNAKTITASYNSTQFAGTGTTVGLTNFSASATLNSNGLNLALSGPIETGVGLSASGSSQSAGAIVFSNSNGLTFGMGGSTVTASYNSTQFAGTGTTFAGTNISGSITQNSNGLNLALSGAAGAVGTNTTFAGTNASASMTLNSNGLNLALSAAAAGTGGAVNFSAGATSANLGSVVFSNSNGVSFGLAGSTITGSVAQSAQTEAIFVAGNSTGQSSQSTYTVGSLNLSAAGLVSAGWSSNSLVISAPATAALTQFSEGISGGNTAGNTGTVTGQVVWAGGNNITLSGSTSGGSMTITVSGANVGGAQTGISGIIASGGTYTSGTVSFSNANGISFGTSGTGAQQAVTASYTVPSVAGLISGINVSATGGTSNNLSGLTFLNSNGVSFGLSTGASVGSLTASVAAQTNQAGSVYGVGNTSGTSSGTYDARTLSISAAGAMTVAASNSGWNLSVPATSSLVGAGAVTVSTNGSTISVSQNTGATFGSSNTYVGTISTNGMSINVPYLTRSINGDAQNITALSAPGNASMSFVYWPCQAPVTASRIDALMGWVGTSSATTNTCAIALSMYAAIYTKNAASLSSLSSGSTQTTYSYASNTAGHTEFLTGAIRPISVPVNVNMMPGEYIVGFNLVTATSSIGLSTTNLAQTFSMYGMNQLQTASNYAEIGSQTAASVNLLQGMGVYSAASTGMPAALSISGIVQTGSSLSQANIALVMRNA